MTANELQHVANLIVPIIENHFLPHKISEVRTALASYINAKKRVNELVRGAIDDLPQLQSAQQQINANRSQLQQIISSNDVSFRSVVFPLKNIDDPLVQSYFGDSLSLIDQLNLVTIDLTNLSSEDDLPKLELLDDTLLKILRLITLHSALKVLNASKDEDLSLHENSLSIIFEDGAFIKTLSEVSDAAREWKITINGIARLVGVSDTDVEILSARRGSFILVISAAYSIVVGITKILNRISDARLKNLEVQMKILEFKNMKMTHYDQAIDLMEKIHQLDVNLEAEKVTKEVAGEYNLNESNEDYHQTYAFVVNSVRNLIGFTNKGGKVDPKILKESTQSEEDAKVVSDLKQKNIGVRMLERKIAALEEGKQILQIKEDNDSSSDNTEQA